MKKAHEVLDNFAIMMTSHPKQQRWLERTLESFEGCSYPIYFGYDDNKVPRELEELIPEDINVTGYPKGKLGHARGELFQMQMLIDLIKEDGYKYFYKTAGDCVHYRWRGFSEILRILNMKDFDLVCRGTSMIFGKVDVFHAIMEPWSTETQAGSAEGYLKHRARRLEARVYPLKAENWELILGRIHVQGEYALNQGIPVSDTWKFGEIWK